MIICSNVPLLSLRCLFKYHHDYDDSSLLSSYAFVDAYHLRCVFTSISSSFSILTVEHNLFPRLIFLMSGECQGTTIVTFQTLISSSVHLFGIFVASGM